jgi:SAM-dependent methyltransferase
MARSARCHQVPDAADVYALGSDTAESARLQRQSDELLPEAVALIDKIGLHAGQSAIDVGCGPSGIVALLAEAAGQSGRTVGLDANPGHIARVRELIAQAGLSGVELLIGDARDTGLATGSFDLVHARTLLVTIPEPAEVLAEMVRLAKPGGWVASQEPDSEFGICYPPLAAWDRMRQIFQSGFARAGADLQIGRRLAEMYRLAGLEEIGLMSYAASYPAGHSRRTVIPDLVRSMRPVIVERGLASERELVDLDKQVREHLADPETVVMPHLLFAAWGRKPIAA